MLLIGSRALLHHYDIIGKVPKDWDYICYEEELVRWAEHHAPVTLEALGDNKWIAEKDGQHYEFDVVRPANGPKSSSHWLLIWEGAYSGSSVVASPEVLLLLKLSHRYRRNSPHFHKTMCDIKFLRGKGVKIPAKLEFALPLREKETYTYAHPNLGQTKDAFFSDDGIQYKYDHDSIHRNILLAGESPAYTKFSADGQEVRSSKRIFLRQDEETKLRAGLEEAIVLSIERSLVPHPGIKTRREAFLYALMKVCTSITSGWFREYCWENYHRISALYDESYYDRFDEAVKQGKVELYRNQGN